MKEKKKVRIEEFVYMLIVICVVVFLFYSDCMDKYLYTLDAVKIVKNCLYIFFRWRNCNLFIRVLLV